jgi:hypothetical protein
MDDKQKIKSAIEQAHEDIIEEKLKLLQAKADMLLAEGKVELMEYKLSIIEAHDTKDTNSKTVKVVQ